MKSVFFISIVAALIILGCKSSPNEFSLGDTDSESADAALALNKSAAAPVVATVVELGTVSKPATVVTRDGGESLLIGGKILWTFGDTIFNTTAADGSTYRSNTAALANPSQPLAVTEPLDANGTPYQALPFTAAEQAYNDSTNNPNDRIALWFGGLVLNTNGSGLAFYRKLYVKGNFIFPAIGVGTANFAPGSTTGVRDPGLLFTASEPQFSRPLLHNGKVYLYGNLNNGDPTLPFGVARASSLAKATKRSAYRFWNGSQWVANIAATAKIFDQIPGQVSVSYNTYLQSFIAVHSGVFSNKVFLRTAGKPEGPWSAPQELFTGMPPASGANRAGLEHPELAKNGGKTIYVSYYRPMGFLQGELRLVEVTFQ